MLLLAASVHAANIADFAEVTGGHYQVLAQGGEQIGREVNGYMNAMLQLYSRYFSNWTTKDAARVVVFNNRDDFREYSRTAVGATHAGLAGYCHRKTDPDGNTFYELVTFESAGLWQVLAHEGFHQFIGYELGEAVPVWLNEGLAQFFENNTVKNGRLIPGGIDAKTLAAAQAVIRARRVPALGELLAMDRRTFYASPEVTYPVSWALVYYLMTRDSASFQSGRFRRYLQDLKWSGDELASFRRRFGRDSAQWEADFHRYILQLRTPVEN
ncbi:MAG: hypothetical protein PCFJNLEI_02935 [Verrucomicrobiae bacterium]|nr:hypothetical protein [Verrucomicrobiae bacterium]